MKFANMARDGHTILCAVCKQPVGSMDKHNNIQVNGTIKGEFAFHQKCYELVNTER
jgi:hypothetical protein